MKKWIALIFLLVSSVVYSQTTYYIRADSVRFQKSGGSSEFILENASRATTGVLVNYGNGRTRFSKPRINGDTLFVGVDTVLGVGSGGVGGGGIGSFQDSIANVRDFGAVGDGVTDDYAAFAAAIATGRTVYVPKGDYAVGTTIAMANPTQTMFGDGYTSKIVNTQATGAVIKVTADSCSIKGIYFWTTGTMTASLPSRTVATYKMGVWVDAWSTTVQDCWFKFPQGRGLWAFDAGAAAVYYTNVFDNRFDSCRVGFEADFGGEYCIVRGNTFTSSYCGIYEGAAGNQIYDANDIKEATRAIVISGAGNGLHGSISNNRLNHNSSGLEVQSGSLGMLVTGNTFYFSTIDIGTSDTVSNLIFVNNLVSGTTITCAKAKNNRMSLGYWYSGVSTAGTGMVYDNIMGGGTSNVHTTTEAGLVMKSTKPIYTEYLNPLSTQINFGYNIGTVPQFICWDGGASNNMSFGADGASYGHITTSSNGMNLYLMNGGNTAGVGIGTNPDASARLHVVSTTKGSIHSPVMTTAQKNAIASPVDGLHVFDSDYDKPFVYNGIWQEIAPIQQTRVITQFDKTNTTLANITGLTATLESGKTYRFEAHLYTTSDVAGGVKVAISGTCTATSIIYEGLTTNAGLITQSRGTALAATVGAVTAVTAAYIVITGTITTDGAGTLTVQFAENAAVNTSSVLVGSTFVVTEML